jgi:YVTN family beta-propeller protein
MMKSKSWLMFLGVFLFCIFFSSTAVYAAPFAYIPNLGSNNVSVIDTATNTVVATITVGSGPYGVAVNPAGTRVYVANRLDSTVSVIDTATNTVIGSPIPVGAFPVGVAVNPAGTRVYVANSASNNVSVIDTATNTVIGSPIPVGAFPAALGLFIGPVPPPSVPAMNSWGMILFMLIAGSGAMYYLRRKKRA